MSDNNLMLYGAAIACVPKKDAANIIHVTFSPISLAQSHPEDITVLDDLKFKASFDLGKPEEAMACFIKITNALDRLVTLQKNSLDAHGLPYRPIALEIGQDSRHPLGDLGEAVFAQLFARRAMPPKSDAMIQMEIINNRRFKNPPYVNPNQITDDDRAYWTKKKSHLQEIFNYQRDVANTKDATIDHAAKQGKSYYAATKPPSDFLDACLKFAHVMEQSSLQWGSFDAANDFNDYEYGGWNERIGSLLERQHHQQTKYHYESNVPNQLIIEAGRFGEYVGQLMNTHWTRKHFDLAMPPGFLTDPAVREKYPVLTFCNENPEHRKAFYAGYYSVLKVPYPRSFKLPLDPQNPPFVDPCADMIRTQFQIIEGSRQPDCIEDKSAWRNSIAAALRATVTELPHLQPQFTNMAAARKAVWPTASGSAQAGPQQQSGEWRDRVVNQADTAAQKGQQL